jgi:multidrug efflux system membrane fusion protein
LYPAAVVLFSFAAACTKRDVASAKESGKKGGEGIPVTLAAATPKDVPLEVQVIGNIEAYSTVVVKSQVTGPLLKVHFKEGDYVKKGDLLFSIDPSPFEAALAEAEANLARGEAQLGQAEAQLKRDQAQARFAGSQAARYDALMKRGIMSKDQTEQVAANADTALEAVRVDEAAIRSARASLTANRAQVQNVRIQLGYCQIRSPLDGRTGNLAVKEGNLVTANTTELITINQVQPIYATFAVPESNLPDIKRYMAGNKLPVTVAPQEGGAELDTGVLTFIDNAVDMSTGTIKLKGTFTNADRRLWPGEFVRVTLRLATQRDAIIVPGQALQEGQDGPFVYVVRQDMTVEARKVQVGSRLGQDVMVAKGLEAGEKVVTEGQLRLSPGMRVRSRESREGSPKGRPQKKSET